MPAPIDPFWVNYCAPRVVHMREYVDAFERAIAADNFTAAGDALTSLQLAARGLRDNLPAGDPATDTMLG